MSSEPKVYKKRPHRKVKSGCNTCKRRKIKCDELKPQCSNCQRYSAECIYPSIFESEHASTSNTPSAPSPESYGDDLLTGSSSWGRGDELPMRDLALMHQWTMSTCYGFGDDFPGDADPWRDHVPVLAQQFPFLMRGILAVSALHLAHMSTDRTTKMRYLRTAAYHQALALPEYRSMLIDVTKEKATVVIAFSAIITVYSFAAPKDPGGLFASGPPEWILLHRGVGEIPTHWQSWIEQGDLAAQMDRRRLSSVDPMLNPEDHRLASLQTMLAHLPHDQSRDTAVYDQALYWLRQAFAHTYNPESRLGPKYAIFFWIERIPQGYVDCLGLQKQVALVILAHFCVLLKRASHSWYFEGVAEHVLSELRPCLGDGVLPWIDWPLQVCEMA